MDFTLRKSTSYIDGLAFLSFDVAGAGASLKRYIDPSFFKRESISSNDRKSKGLREKKTRRLKSRKLTATADSELGLEIVEISIVGPLKESLKSDKSLQSSPYSRELEMKPYMDDFGESKGNEVIDSGALELPATIESEIGTDSECRKTSRYSNAKPLVADFYGSEGRRRPQSLFPDSQLVDNSTASEDGNNFFKGRENSSCLVSMKSMAESTTALEMHVVTPEPASKSDPDHISFDSCHLSKRIPRNETEEHERAGDGAVEGDEIPKSTQAFGETSNVSYLTDVNTMGLPIEATPGEKSLPDTSDKEYSSFLNPGGVAIQSAPKGTDHRHWSNGELPLNDEESWNTGVHPETSHDLPNTLHDFVHLAHIASRKADSTSLLHQLLSRENSEDQFKCKESLNIDKQSSETNNPDHAPLFDSALGALPRFQEDYSIEKIITDLEADKDTSSCSIVGVNEALPPVSNALQAHSLESFSSEIASPTETTNSGYLEAAPLNTLSFGAEPNSKAVFGSADKTGEQRPGNNFDVHEDSVSVGENEPDDILNTVSLKRASVSQNFTIDQKRLGLMLTQAIQSDVTNGHECYKYYVDDKSKDFSCHGFPSDMHTKPAISSNSASAAEDESTMDYNVVKAEHIEIVANGCREIDAEKDIHEDVMLLYSSDFWYAEKL
ncbi:hypothetical protein Cgig2_001161 [Carnegiea gigantea]|uniref:Protein SCAR n=1 Tax=Carnegiea gigantea TaxID=171969 RepID=A0A9Q1K439_9CARY|nr:hypothetical protein Cgig2_001161 [Carnegiea gigantea]